LRGGDLLKKAFNLRHSFPVRAQGASINFVATLLQEGIAACAYVLSNFSNDGTRTRRRVPRFTYSSLPAFISKYNWERLTPLAASASATEQVTLSWKGTRSLLCAGVGFGMPKDFADSQGAPMAQQKSK
jgi:hypothetical protein